MLGVRETKKNIYDEKVGFAYKNCVARGSSFFMKFGGGGVRVFAGQLAAWLPGRGWGKGGGGEPAGFRM